MFDPRMLSGPFGNVARFNVFGEQARGLLDDDDDDAYIVYGQEPPLNTLDDHYTATGMSPQYQGPTLVRPKEEDGMDWGSLLGRQGPRETSNAEISGLQSANPQALPNPMQTLQGLMAVVGAGGQPNYEHFIPQRQNSWLPGLMG